MLLHPVFVVLAWTRLYGWLGWYQPGIKLNPETQRVVEVWKPGLLGFGSLGVWLAILVHDWGYWGCSAMDDERGEAHPKRVAEALLRVGFDVSISRRVLCHSRFYAQQAGLRVNRLYRADKIGNVLMPGWLWTTLAWLSGEGYEYMRDPKYEIHREEDLENLTWRGLRRFYGRFREWVEANVEGAVNGEW